MAAVPVRFALRYSPATLACEYKAEDGRLRTLKIVFEHVNAGTDAQEVLDLTKAKLGEVINVDDVDSAQLQSLVLKLIAGSDGGGGVGSGGRSSSRGGGGAQEMDPDDLPADLRAAMGLGDPDRGSQVSSGVTSTYSRLTLTRVAESSAKSKAAEKAKPAAKQKLRADDDDGFDDLLDDLLDDDIDAPLDKQERKPAVTSSSTSSHGRQVGQRTEQPAPEPEPEEDLNKVSDFRLRVAKRQMDEQFEKNLVRPGMEGYEYDKAVEFEEAEEDMSWDDSD